MTASLAACGSSEPSRSADVDGTADDTVMTTGEAPAPTDSAESGAPRAADPDTTWALAVTSVGGGLTLNVRGDERLRIACVRESREMAVDVPGFSSIGSEERLSFGIDDEPYVFVAQVTPPPPAGVHATRAIDEEVLTALGAAMTVSAHYGTQSSGPHAAPDSSLLQDFLYACRQAAAQ